MIWIRLESVRIALQSVPVPEVWAKLAGLYFLFVAVALALGFATGFFAFRPIADPALKWTLPFLLLVRPALLEEIVFRGALVPHPREPVSPRQKWVLAVASLIAFVAMHPLNGLLFRPSVLDLFLNPVFLALALALGLVCTLAYVSSGSLWPSILMHWITVTFWIEFLGGATRLGYVNR